MLKTFRVKQYIRSVKLDIHRIDDLLRLGHLEIVIALLIQTRKAIQVGKPLMLQTISESENDVPHSVLNTVEQFDSWLTQTPSLVRYSLYDRVVSSKNN